MVTGTRGRPRTSVPATTRSLVRQSLLMSLALVLGVLVSTTDSVATAVLGRVALAVVIGLAGWWILAPSFRGKGRWARAKPLAQRILVRSVLVVAVVVSGAPQLMTPREPAGLDIVPPAVAALFLIAAPVIERPIARLIKSKGPYAHNLPGATPVPLLPDHSRAMVAANLAVTALGLVLQATVWGSVVWALLATLAFLPSVLLGVLGFRRIPANRRLAEAIHDAVADYAPEFVVYTARPDDASYQVTMWLPYLRRADHRFLIITRSRKPAEALAELTDVPVVVCPKVSDLEAMLVPSLRAAFYVNASSGNGVFIRNSQLTHVYLGHGDSDKPPSYNPTHAMYDEIFAAGAAATRRYADHGVRIPDDRFRVVGRPQVEDVRVSTEPISAVSEPTVLYAPTWRGHVQETKFDSLPEGDRIVGALLERGATVIFRPHPFSYSFPDDAARIRRIQAMLESDAARSGRRHRWGAAAETEWSILDCINASDAMVSDVSSVVSDYLFSNKPFAMVAVPSEPESFVQDYPIARAAYVLAGDLGNLAEVLDELLQSDSARGRREAVRVDYLGDFPAATYAEAFVEAVRAVVSPQDALTADEHPEPQGDEPPEPEQSAEDSDEEDEEVPTTGPEAEEDQSDTGADRPPPAPKPSRSKLVRELVELIKTLLLPTTAVLGLASSLAGIHLAAFGFGALTVIAFLVLHRRGLRRLRNRNRMVASFGSARAVVAASTGVLWLEDHANWWIVAATCVLVASVGAERTIANGWRRVGVQSSGMPELANPTTEVLPRWLVPISYVVVVLVGYALLWWRQPAWTWFLLVAVQLTIMIICLVTSQLRVYRAARISERLVPTLEEYAPEFTVYFASSGGADYQVGMWLPYFDRIGRPYVIVVRDLKMLRQISRMTDRPVIHRPTLRSVEEILVPSLRTAFYVNNAVRNTHLIERRELTHVWLNHGDSEKPACYNPVHAIYDLLFAAGQAGIDRYARHGVDIPREKFRIVGRPQVEQIEKARGPIADIENPTVLYAPTWRGPYADSRVYSLPQGTEIVRALLARGVRVVFRAHPFNYQYADARRMIREVRALLQEDTERTGREHVHGPAAEKDMSVEDCFNASDAMISDISAVVSDYLQSEKPFSMVAVGHTPAELFEIAPASRAAYVLREDLANIDAVLDDLLRADPLLTERQRTRVYYLGDFPAEHYADGFLSGARAVIDDVPQPVVDHA